MSALPAVIILHGWGLSSERFTSLAQGLQKTGYRVFVPDFPGFGKSSMPSYPLHLSDYVDFLDTYVQKKKLDSYVLIGHSFGGRVTLKYSEVARPGLHGIVLTGTPGVTPIAKKKLFLFIFLAKIGKFFFSAWPLSLFREKIRLWYYHLVGAREFNKAQGVMRETFKLIVQEELLTAMKRISVPSLLVWGSLDTITPVWIAQKMHEIIKHSKLIIIPDRDHGVPYKDPELFIQHIRTFMHSL